jgi:hypothetical protein
MPANLSNLPLGAIKPGRRHRQDLGDVAGLAESIVSVGLLQPLAVRPDHVLVAGARRLAALRLLGWDTAPVRVVFDLDDELRLLEAECAENTCRKAFTPEECVLVKWEYEGPLREQALARMKAGKKPPANVAEGQGETRDAIERLTGMGHTTLDKAEYVVVAARDEPETFGPVKEEMNRTGNVNAAYQQVLRARAAPPAAPPVPRYPHHERFTAWVEHVRDTTRELDTAGGTGGVKAMLADRDKWDWKDVKEHVLPMLDSLLVTLTAFYREVKQAADRERR